MARGPRPPAITPEAIALVHEDIAYQAKAGFAEAVYWDENKDGLHAHLKV